MKQKLKACALIIACFWVAGSINAAGKGKPAPAAAPSGEAFSKSKLYVGAGLGLGAGLGYLGGVAFLANAEYAVTNEIGVGGSVGYWSYSEELSYTYPFVGNYTVKYKYSVIPIVASGAYHFHIGNPKLDLSAGLSLGYYIVSSSTEVSNTAISNSTIAAGTASGIAWGVFGAVRYFVSDNLALRAKLGYGITVVEVGVDFRI